MGKKEEKQDASGYCLNNDINNHVCSSAKLGELQTCNFWKLLKVNWNKAYRQY